MKSIRALWMVTAALACNACRKPAVPRALPSESPSYQLANSAPGYSVGTRYIDRLVIAPGKDEGHPSAPSITMEQDIRWEVLAPDRMELKVLRYEFLDTTTRKSIRPEPEGSLTGVPIYLRKSADQWQPEQPLPAELSNESRRRIEAYALTESKNYEQLMYSTIPRHVGESWTTRDPKAFFDEPADDVSGLCIVTFTAVEASQGKTIAHLHLDTEFQGRPRSSGSNWTRWHFLTEVRRSIEDKMDLETTSEGIVESWAAEATLGDAPKSQHQSSAHIVREILK